MTDLRNTPITILGAGAIGGTVGAFLHDAGYDVTLVDVVPEHVQAINQHGLKITGYRGERTFPVRAIHADDLQGPLGVTFLCVKGHFTDAAMERYGPMLAEDGYVVSLQNGLNEEIIARHVGAGRTVGAFVHFGADYIEPGLIQLAHEQHIFIGELDGRESERVEVVRTALNNVMPAHVTTNIHGYLWGKLVYGAMAFLISTVDATIPDVIDSSIGMRLCQATSGEAYLVARSQADKLEMIGEFDPNMFAAGPDFEKNSSSALLAMAAPMRGTVKQHMGIWRDLKIKKRKTEVDMQIAPLVEVARREGIPAPVNEAVLDIIHDIEEGRRGMEWSNFDEIANRAGIVI